jgi:hypothetical protein
MFRKPPKYRPGIDEPPPSRWMWLLGALGLAGMTSLVVGFSRRFGKRR